MRCSVRRSKSTLIVHATVALVILSTGWTPSRANPVVVAEGAYVYGRMEGRSVSWIPYALGGSSQSPKAIRFVGRHDRTYVVYADRDAHPMICYYDHDDARWSVASRVGRSSRPGNPHSVPALAVTEDGYLHVFYGSHGSEHFMRRSSEPESTAGWDSVRVVSSRATYHNVNAIGNTLYLLQRDRSSGDPRWGLKTSEDGGETWSAHRELFAEGPDRAYPTLLVDFSTGEPVMHMFWLVYSQVDGWRDMRYVRSRDLGRSWSGAVGVKVETPIPLRGGDLVHSGPTHGWQNEIVVDPAGGVGLLFVTGGEGIADDNTAMFARWTGERWRVSSICAAESRFCHGTVLVRGDDTFAVYFASGTLWGGEVTEWLSDDEGLTWSRAGQLTQASPFPNNYPEPVLNRSPELELVWCSGGTKFTGQIHAWGSAGTLRGPETTDGADGAPERSRDH